MRSTTIIVALATTVLFSCQKEATQSLNASTQSNAATHTSRSEPYEDDLWNPCTNEWVHVTGTFSFNANFKIVNGKMITEESVHYNLSGTGNTSGTKYEGKGVFTNNGTDEWNAEAGYFETKNSNTVQKITLNTAGGGNNLVTTHSFKVVYDANHNLKIFDEKLEYQSCQ